MYFSSQEVAGSVTFFFFSDTKLQDTAALAEPQSGSRASTKPSQSLSMRSLQAAPVSSVGRFGKTLHWVPLPEALQIFVPEA